MLCKPHLNSTTEVRPHSLKKPINATPCTYQHLHLSFRAITLRQLTSFGELGKYN